MKKSTTKKTLVKNLVTKNLVAKNFPMKNLLLTLGILGLLAVAQGCVTPGEHKKLQDQYDKTAADLTQCQGQVTTDESKIHDQELVIKDLESKLGSTSSAKTKLESNVTEMKAALDAQSKQKAEADKRMQEYRNFIQKFKSLTDTGKIAVRIKDGQMVVTLSSDVLFAPGSAKLNDDGIKAVNDVTKLLASVPDRSFQVAGYTDNKPIKVVYPSNWELAAARSMTVLKTMLSAGMPPQRISAASYGETKPVQTNDTEEGRAINRRIEIVVVPDLSKLPGYDELQKMASP